MNVLFRFLLLIKKVKIVVVFKNKNSDIFKLLLSVFGTYIQSEKISLPLKKFETSLFLKNKLLLIEVDSENKKELKQLSFLIKKSLYSVLILEKELTEKDFGMINFLFKAINKKGIVVMDSKNSKNINLSGVDVFKVGFSEESNLWASDLNLSENTNFKLNHHGDVVPFWFDEILDQDKIKNVLLAVAVGMIFNLNLVEISQNLKKTDSQ